MRWRDNVVQLKPLAAAPLRQVKSKRVQVGREVQCVFCGHPVMLTPWRNEQLHLCSECKYVYLLTELWIRCRKF